MLCEPSGEPATSCNRNRSALRISGARSKSRITFAKRVSPAMLKDTTVSEALLAAEVVAEQARRVVTNKVTSVLIDI